MFAPNANVMYLVNTTQIDLEPRWHGIWYPAAAVVVPAIVKKNDTVPVGKSRNYRGRRGCSLVE
jgi:hypothetical protein